MIQTVTGAIEASELGHCQMHEHLIVRATPAADANPALLIDDEARSAAELALYRAAGGGAVLDAQPGGAGRDAMALARISEESGVPVVCVTGYHLPVFYERDHWIFTEPEDALCERFTDELTVRACESPTGRPIRAGAVKAALGEDGATGRCEMCLRAAARAAVRADVPLVVHTERGLGAVNAVALCERAGLSPTRILICHADRQARDYAAHEAIARTGAFLEYDTIARPKYHDDDDERRLIMHMLDKGFTSQLLLSLDTTAARLASYGGATGLTYLLNDFLPSLRAMGVAQDTLNEITIANPARVFG